MICNESRRENNKGIKVTSMLQYPAWTGVCSPYWSEKDINVFSVLLMALRVVINYSLISWVPKTEKK